MSEPGVALAEFLGARMPFQELGDDELASVADQSEVRRIPAGGVVAEYGDGAPDAVSMLYSGRVALTAPGDDITDAFEMIGPGELFGYLPLIIGAAARFSAWAIEPSVVIALPADTMRELFGRRCGLTFVASNAWRSIEARQPASNSWTSSTRVAELVKRPPIVVDADTPVADAVRAMGSAGESAVLIPHPDGSLGIVTESDVTHRVVGAGLPSSVPVSQIMTHPARTVDADRYAITTWLEMLEAQVRHMPVCDPRGKAVGVLDETDLLVAASRGGSLQRTIAEARDAKGLARQTQSIRRLADELFDSGLDAESTSGVLSLVIDIAARRAVELSLADRPEVNGFAWITLGSIARREAMPSSDIDSALSWSDENDGRAHQFRDMARRTHEILAVGDLPEDSNGAVAYLPRFSRSATAWTEAARGWLDEPLSDRGLIMSSLLIDGRVIVGPAALHTAPSAYASMPTDHPEALRLQLLDALSLKPRVRAGRPSLLRRSDTVDLKTHVVSPVVNPARWAGLTAGVTCAPTPARLHSAVDAGSLAGADASVLHEVFSLTQRIRMRRQIEQIRAGHTPGDLVVMSELTPLERSMLAEGVREIADIQRRVRNRAALTGS
ncbi:putative nucleotidyltransferase substrate binding domain-containing protein [Gordonia sp. NPDC003585]|uniref:putative nucleotidyltransferase substrate binding domain-containing protein n=1 Tax=Gordonia sp. NPDC003585 TaxID=3154275 RepID=UPI0033B33C98